MCINVSNLLKVQQTVMRESIEYHAWCNKIEDKNEAYVDFINKFGWIMRATYCSGLCPHRETCDVDWKEVT